MDRDPDEVVMLTGIYDADGGLRGEISYLLGALAGRHCSLCDITHAAVRRRRSWDAYVETLPVPFDVVHRNERSPQVAAATTGREPCIVAHTADGRIIIVLGDTELRAAGSVERLGPALDAGLVRCGLHFGTGSPG